MAKIFHPAFGEFPTAASKNTPDLLVSMMTKSSAVLIERIPSDDQAFGVTQNIIDAARQRFSIGDRAGAYLILMAANGGGGGEQLFEQAQITTYSQGYGSMAAIANYFAKWENPEKYLVSLDRFSEQILLGTIQAFQSKLDKSNKNPVKLSADELQEADQNVWGDSFHNMRESFPGNAEIGLVSHSIDKFSLLSKGSRNNIQLGMAYHRMGLTIGKRPSEYSKFPDYITHENDNFIQVYHKYTGITEVLWDKRNIFEYNSPPPLSFVPVILNYVMPNEPLNSNMPAYHMRAHIWEFVQANNNKRISPEMNPMLRYNGYPVPSPNVIPNKFDKFIVDYYKDTESGVWYDREGNVVNPDANILIQQWVSDTVALRTQRNLPLEPTFNLNKDYNG